MSCNSKHLSSDPSFLLEYMDRMSEPDSDSDFDGYADNSVLEDDYDAQLTRPESSNSSFQNYSLQEGFSSACGLMLFQPHPHVEFLPVSCQCMNNNY